MNSKVKQRLIENKTLSAEQFHTVEQFAVTKGVTEEKALVLLNFLKPQDLGMCLSDFHQLPYISLQGRTIPPGAGASLSPDCIKRWKVLPMDYDPRLSLITLAVSSVDQALMMERVFLFLMESNDLAFTVAPEFEIEEAIAELLGEKKANEASGAPGAPPVAAAKPRLVLSALQKRVDEIKQGRGPEPAVRPQEKQQERTAQDRQPERQREDVQGELLTSLASAISLLVTAHLGSDQNAVGVARARARYCQLTATRLNLAPAQTTKVVLAAWLCALENKREIIRQFVSPYDLENMIFPQDTGGRHEVESLVLSLVRCYQGLEEESPAEARDVNMVRRGLHLRWPAATEHQDILETFLQVLMDEQFLDKLGKHAGTILLIDPAAASSNIESSLRRAGHDVKVAAGVGTAQQMFSSEQPVMIIANAGAAAKDMLAFCRQIKADQGAPALPIVVIVPAKSDVKGTDFLRIGVDDVLSPPVDVEMLYLKIEKLLGASSRQAARTGVSGSLADMSFCDLIQVLSAGCKSVEIDVRKENQQGKLFLKEGNVIHAETAGVAGEDAFYRLMQWRSGEFSMKECSVFPEPTVMSSTMSLLMEGARLVDEKVPG
ncbi:MAG: hypothetical protein C0404_05345 [Verrucomicrobia bacterium]|nr:hypothetical protein [Verrucomicrobiota bacterium]